MKWDHIGLQQQSFSQTFDLAKTGARTERPNQPIETLDQEDCLQNELLTDVKDPGLMASAVNSFNVESQGESGLYVLREGELIDS